MRRTISPGFRPIRVRRFAKACLRPRWRTTRASKSVRHPSPGRTFRLRSERRHNSWRYWHMRLPRREIQRRHPDLMRIRRLSRHSHQWMRPWMRTERRPSCKRGSACSRAYSIKFRRAFRHYRFPITSGYSLRPPSVHTLSSDSACRVMIVCFNVSAMLVCSFESLSIDQ